MNSIWRMVPRMNKRGGFLSLSIGSSSEIRDFLYKWVLPLSSIFKGSSSLFLEASEIGVRKIFSERSIRSGYSPTGKVRFVEYFFPSL